MADKVKTAFLLAGGCAGCEMSVVDLSEKLVDALEHLEIVFWAPTVADIKYADLEEMPDKSIDLAFVDGMIRNTENLHTVKVLRQKSKVLVAFGACACIGGPYWDSYAVVRGAESFVDVDHFIAGCPPPPSALDGFLDDLRGQRARA